MKGTRTLSFLGIDSWNRPVYEDQTGRLWKNVKHLASSENNVKDTVDGLTTVYGNCFDGEPDVGIEYMKEKPEIDFAPRGGTGTIS